MDWEHIGTIAVAVFTQGWSFIAVALTVYFIGQSVKNLAGRKGWRAAHEDEASWFDATLPVQPLLVGALLMQIPFPVWESIDGLGKSDGVWTEAAARLAYGSLAGALCGQIFESIQSLLRFARKRLGISDDGRKTPMVTTPKMVPSSTVAVVTPISEVEPATDPMPSSDGADSTLPTDDTDDEKP